GDAAEEGHPEKQGGGAVDDDAPAEGGDEHCQQRAHSIERDVSSARASRWYERLPDFVEDRPRHADRERDRRRGPRRQLPTVAKGAIPERREYRVFREMAGLADEHVQGVELGRRGPRRQKAKERDDPVLGVLGAPDVG